MYNICSIKTINIWINISKHISVTNSLFQIISHLCQVLYSFVDYQKSSLHANYNIWLTLTSLLIYLNDGQRKKKKPRKETVHGVQRSLEKAPVNCASCNESQRDWLSHRYNFTYARMCTRHYYNFIHKHCVFTRWRTHASAHTHRWLCKYLHEREYKIRQTTLFLSLMRETLSRSFVNFVA